jgi:hypothetical protein
LDVKKSQNKSFGNIGQKGGRSEADTAREEQEKQKIEILGMRT